MSAARDLQSFFNVKDDARLSRLTAGIQGSQILRIAAEIDGLQKAGKPICNLTVGDYSPREFPVPQRYLDLHAAVESLRLVDGRAAALIDLRFFGGFSMEEAAAVLDLSLSHAGAIFRTARAWLRSRLDGRSDVPGDGSDARPAG